MLTEFWGPSAWKLIHAISFTAPDVLDEQQQGQYGAFFHSLAKVLPCGGCRAHFQQRLESHPPDLTTGDSIARWVFDAHEAVNRRNGKTDGPSYAQVKKAYSGGLPMSFSALSAKEQRDRLGDPFFMENRGMATNDMFITLVGLMVAVIVVYVIYITVSSINSPKSSIRDR